MGEVSHLSVMYRKSFKKILCRWEERETSGGMKMCASVREIGRPVGSDVQMRKGNGVSGQVNGDVRAGVLRDRRRRL